jgi:hypothetical protein
MMIIFSTEFSSMVSLYWMTTSGTVIQGRRVSLYHPACVLQAARQQFAPGNRLRDNAASEMTPMVNSANLFRLLNEFIVLLLGALLMLLARSGRVGLPSRPAALIALGIVFLYWGFRAWIRPEPKVTRLQSRIRAGSLALVGFFILAIPLAALRNAPMLLGLAGGVLVLRGILGMILFVRSA